jgi:hypothetical protein
MEFGRKVWRVGIEGIEHKKDFADIKLAVEKTQTSS